MQLVVATRNAGKLDEIRALLAGEPIELVALDGLPNVVLPEGGEDYRANAIAKARAAAEQLGRATVADDSGLEVDALGGRPGPRSARYGGLALGDRGRVARLLEELRGVPDELRTARFVCHVALVFPDPEGALECAEGVCEGVIRSEPSGRAGFGYDPIFQANGEAATMAELPPERKNAISHRALAFAALAQTSSWASRLST